MSDPIRLDIGCGAGCHRGYTGVDIDPSFGHLVADARHLPYEDSSVAEIFSSHLIEHVADTDALLAEWFRVLQPGGVLTVRCPNLLGMVEAWLAMKPEQRWSWFFTQHLFGWADVPEPMRHRTGFEWATLEAALVRAGFIYVMCDVVETRHSSGPEYMPDGDLLCTGVKP